MKHLFVIENIAQLARDKGFNEICLAAYGAENDDDNSFQIWEEGIDNNASSHLAAPTYQQLIDWFREKHCIHICPKHHITSQTYGFVITGKYKGDIMERLIDHTFGKYEYYEMLNIIFKEAFKLI